MNKKNIEFTLDFDDFDDIQGPSPFNNKKSQQKKQNSDQKKNSVHSKSQLMFQSKTISKGFFAEPNQSYAQLMCEDSSPTKLNSKKEVNQNQQNAIKSRRKKKIDALQPLNKETKKVQVFRNIQSTNNLSNKQNDNNLQKSKSKEKKTNEKELKIKLPVEKTKRKIIQEEIIQQAPIQKVQVNKVEKQKLLQKQQKLKQQIPKDIVNNSQLQKPQIQKKVDQKSAEDQKIQDDEDSPNKLTQQSRQELQKHIIKIMSSPLKPKTVMKTTIQRNASGFNTFWPIFHLYFLQDKSYLISAKKTSSKPTSTFIMTASKQNFQQNTQYYLGKVKSNFMGDTLTIFGPGLSPNQAFQKKKRPRQVLATVVYQSSYFQGGKPRDFRVYLKKTNVDYYKAFPQVKLYEDQIPLNLLYQNQANRDKIILLKNRAPQYRQEIKGYMLNFKGRVTKPSIKNFILEDAEAPGVDVMLFGKNGEDVFSMDVYHPLSPCIGFGIAMSSFDSRILIE